MSSTTTTVAVPESVKRPATRKPATKSATTKPATSTPVDTRPVTVIGAPNVADNRRPAGATSTPVASKPATSTRKPATSTGRKPASTTKPASASTKPATGRKPAGTVKPATVTPIAERFSVPEVPGLSTKQIKELIGRELINAAAKLAGNWNAKRTGVPADVASAQMGQWLSYLPDSSGWSDALGPRSNAGRRNRTAAQDTKSA